VMAGTRARVLNRREQVLLLLLKIRLESLT